MLLTLNKPLKPLKKKINNIVDKNSRKDSIEFPKDRRFEEPPDTNKYNLTKEIPVEDLVKGLKMYGTLSGDLRNKKLQTNVNLNAQYPIKALNGVITPSISVGTNREPFYGVQYRKNLK